VIAAAGSQLWLATARGAYLLDGDHVRPTGVAAAAADHRFGIAGGDAVAARGGARRLANWLLHDQR
jgi:hypothetical protein